MKRNLVQLTLAAALLVAGSACASRHDGTVADAPASAPSTLRIDVVHTGSASSESFALDQLILEGPWPGNPTANIDLSGYGPYYFEIRDPETSELLFSQGFASIFGEWQTIPEALDTVRTFHESLRVPAPERTVELIVFKRNTTLDLVELWRERIDPAAAQPRVNDQRHTVWSIVDNGPPREKVDILFLGDGYTVDEMDQWHHDARRLADTLFSYEPFMSRRDEFNVRAIDTPSDASGIANPSAGRTHETPIGATYDSFGMERYVLTFANRRWRDVAGSAPYEFVVIIANDEKYGGAGIYNLFSTVSADNDFTPYVLVHEFGHHFAGLGDEYYTSDVSYSIEDERPEPWSPNVTSSPENPKWSDLVADETPLPTPWPKMEFERLQAEIQSRRSDLRNEGAPEDEIEALFREERVRSAELLGEAEYAHHVGAFEGANYASTGYYRPEINCIMFTRDVRHFCRVCTRAVNRTIDRYVP